MQGILLVSELQTMEEIVKDFSYALGKKVIALFCAMFRLLIAFKLSKLFKLSKPE